MPLSAYFTTKESLRPVMKEVPDLSPTDSLSRFAQLSSYYNAEWLPVIEQNQLLGMISCKVLLKAFEVTDQQERDAFLAKPLSEFMQPALHVAPPEMPLQEVEALFGRAEVDTVPVVDEEGYCLGMILARDILNPVILTPRPPLIGGMATPYGVYLTDGNIQAGASNFALLLSGMLLGLFFTITLWVSDAVLTFGEQHGLPKGLSNDIEFATTAQNPKVGLLNIAARVLTLTLLLILMRMNRLAGFHAAEHQTVHAIERTERLTPEIVGRMPRAHPRCGTNIMAGATVFFVALQLALSIPYTDSIAPLFALFTTLFYWRRVGAFLQERFTTRPATKKQLESGIKAGEELLRKYWSQPPTRPRLWRRIWCMGLAQNMAGVTLIMYLAEVLRTLLQPYLHF